MSPVLDGRGPLASLLAGCNGRETSEDMILDRHTGAVAATLPWASWVSPDYFRRQLGTQPVDNEQVWIVDANRALANPDGLHTNMWQLCKPGNILFSEIPSDRVSEFRELVETIGPPAGKPVEIRIADAEVPVEVHYELHVSPSDITSTTFSDGIRINDLWRRWVSQGRRQSRPRDGAAVLTDLTDQSVEEIWELYIDAMSVLTQQHPTEQTYPEEGFRDLISHPDATFIGRYAEYQLVSVTIVVSDPRLANWLDESYLHQRYRGYCDDGRMFIVPAIATQPSVQGLGYVSDTLRLLIDLVAASRRDSLAVFSANTVSRHYTPHIAQYGIDIHPSVEGKVREFYRYEYRAWQFPEIDTKWPNDRSPEP